MSLRYLRFLLLGSGAAVFAASANGASAEERVTDSNDIIVTAQKREQSVQEVGIAISVLNGQQLAAKAITGVQEVAASIPNVQANVAGDIVSFNIRGIGQSEFATNLDSPVAINVDDIYFSKTFMTGLMLFDVDRVEALKGPQGTLYGRNATGGAINVFTRRPTPTWQAGATVGYDNYQTLRGEAYVSGPLSDKLSARLSGMYADQGKGFYRDTTLGRREGAEDKRALRLQLQWDDGVTAVRLAGHYGRDRSTLTPYEGVGVFTPESLAAGAPVFCAAYLAGKATGGNAGCVRGTDGGYPGDNNPYTATNNLIHQAHSKGYGLSLNIEHDLGWASLTSITGYNAYDRHWQEDSDGSPVTTIDAYWRAKIEQYTQEVRLTGRHDRWNYTLGAYFEHDRLKSGDILAVAGGAAAGYYSPFIQKVDAFALYFHNEVGLTDTLQLVAGVRYSKERVSIDGETYIFTGLTGSGPQPQNLLVTSATSDALPEGNSQTSNQATFKVGVEWKPVIASAAIDKLMVYGHVSTGFRSGGYNAEFAGLQSSFTSLKPEKITAYEAGFKSTLFDRLVTANAGLFHYAFSDGFINVDSPDSPVPVTINAASIDSYGAEFELGLHPARGLSLNNSLAWLDSKISSAVFSGGVALQNNRTINSPRWSYAVDGSYSFDIGADLTATIGANANYRSSQYLEANNSPSSREGGYWLVGGRMSIGAADGKWLLAGWVKNLTKTIYRSYVNDLPGFGFLLNVYGQPRTFGSTLTVKI